MWNLGLEQRNHWTKNRGQLLPRLTFTDQARFLTEARQHTWLGEGGCHIQQQALRDLDQAFKNWWGNPGHFGRPTWRKAGRNEGFCVTELTVKRLNRKWATVNIPKAGHVKFKLGGRSFNEIAKCKSVRVTLDRSGRWHVSFTSPQPSFQRVQTGAEVGIDLGVTHSVTTSDAEHFDMSDILSSGERRRKVRIERKLARQQKGSNRRERTRVRLARIKAREADRRKDWIEKTTTRLVREYDFIAIEDLKVANMTRSARGTLDAPGKNVAQKRGLNREIQNQAWGLFRKRLEDKAAAAVDANGESKPVTVVAVNPACTSQRCNKCDHVSPENRESQAVFRCKKCGHADNADVNAARNILAAGRAVTGRRAIPSRTSQCETGYEASTELEAVA